MSYMPDSISKWMNAVDKMMALATLVLGGATLGLKSLDQNQKRSPKYGKIV